MNILVEHSWTAFLVGTVLIGGGAAWMSGSALAGSWRPLWMAIAYMLPLGLAVRFFHYALGDGQLLSLHYLVVDMAILVGIAAISHRVTETSLIVKQYPWLYRKTSPMTWANVTKSRA